MELVEFEIGHPAARSPGSRDTVAARAIRVGGVSVCLAGATRCQHYSVGGTGFYPGTIGAQEVGAGDAVAHLDDVNQTAIGE